VSLEFLYHFSGIFDRIYSHLALLSNIVPVPGNDLHLSLLFLNGFDKGLLQRVTNRPKMFQIGDE
jgi:hypothetical protein